MSNAEGYRQETFRRVRKVMMEMLRVMQEGDPSKAPNISMETDLYNDLGIDSLETLDLLNGLEEEFGVSPDQYEASSKRKISEIVDYVIDLEAQKRSKVR